ncbi:hypothetical protein ADMFC3_28620 [Geovibrio sp. ADMFC3]|jgi:hypothetical protein|nr:hypothetical protein [Deferribacteraceae bacterium]
MKKLLVLAFIICFAGSAFADDIKLRPGMTQNDFKTFAKELGSVISFDPNSPADPLGLLGFDIAAEASFNIIDTDVWDHAASDGDSQEALIMYRLHAQKGLPGKIDIGAMIGQSANSDLTVAGVSIKYAILEGTMATPALSVRAAYSQTVGHDEIDAYNANIGVFISKGILIIKPYAGIVGSMNYLKEKSDAVDLDTETAYTAKGILGIQVTPFPFLKFNAEAGIGEINQLSLKAGIRF